MVSKESLTSPQIYPKPRKNLLRDIPKEIGLDVNAEDCLARYEAMLKKGEFAGLSDKQLSSLYAAVSGMSRQEAAEFVHTKPENLSTYLRAAVNNVILHRRSPHSR